MQQVKQRRNQLRTVQIERHHPQELRASEPTAQASPRRGTAADLVLRALRSVATRTDAD